MSQRLTKRPGWNALENINCLSAKSSQIDGKSLLGNKIRTAHNRLLVSVERHQIFGFFIWHRAFLFFIRHRIFLFEFEMLGTRAGPISVEYISNYVLM